MGYIESDPIWKSPADFIDSKDIFEVEFGKIIGEKTYRIFLKIFVGIKKEKRDICSADFWGKDYFYLKTYWEQFGITSDETVVMRPFDMPFEQFVDRFSSLVLSTLEGPLRDAIEGKSWPKVLFDWGDYK